MVLKQRSKELYKSERKTLRKGKRKQEEYKRRGTEKGGNGRIKRNSSNVCGVSRPRAQEKAVGQNGHKSLL